MMDQAQRGDSVTPGPSAAPDPAAAVAPVESFWAELLRVQSDKLILLALIVLLHLWHGDDKTQASVVGALLLSIQSARFRWRK